MLQHFFHQLGLKRTDYIDLTFFSFVLHVDNIPVLKPEGAVYVIELKMITLLELHLNLSHNSRSLQYWFRSDSNNHLSATVFLSHVHFYILKFGMAWKTSLVIPKTSPFFVTPKDVCNKHKDEYITQFSFLGELFLNNVSVQTVILQICLQQQRFSCKNMSGNYLFTRAYF